MKRRNRAYKFTEKRHSAVAAIGLCIALLSVGMFLYAVVVSFAHRGQAEAVIGCVGIAAILVAGFGFVISVRQVRREEIYKRVPAAGLAVSALSLIGWSAIYVLGWVVWM